VVDGVLYGTSPQLKLLALNASTGEELWRFDPFAYEDNRSSVGLNRGVVYWSDGADERVLFTADHFLYAVSARTGLPVDSFGTRGRVDLKEGMGRDLSRLQVASNTPGAVYGDLLFMPLRVGEGPGPAAPGHVRAYDIRTGTIKWIFRTVPSPGEDGYETWPPDAWTHIGGANVWTGMAVDEERGLVFCPTGSAAFDFWGGNRIGANLFANCLIALDVHTGERVWHYQFVHHDLWDRDLPAPPNLLTVQHKGRTVDAVAQVTKSGHVFVFDRETGEPLFPIEEHAVPPSDLQGESAWATQPLPVKPAPFTRQVFTYDEITDITPESRRAALNRFAQVRPHAPFMPPSTEGTIIFPGFDGGAEWGGAAVDPDTGILYVNANEMPWILTMIETRRDEGLPVVSGRQIYQQICAACHGLDRKGNAQGGYPTLIGIDEKLTKDHILALLETGRGVMPSVAFLSPQQKEVVVAYVLGDEEPTGAEPQVDITGGGAIGRMPYAHTGYIRWTDTNGYPAVKPPWGTLNAINLNTGDYEWTVPLGEIPALSARGIPVTGTEKYGGPIVTAGGLLFIAASRDETIRAFDKRTGAELWKAVLPAGGYATPATYEVDSKQFVVIACGGGKMGTKSGDAYVAFALP